MMTNASQEAGGYGLRKECNMKLHFNRLSSSARRVTITANLLGVKLDEHSVDLRDPAAREALARVNPNVCERTAGRLPIRPFEHVLAWLGRLSELPAWQATEPPPIG
jgi:glutathione S-transferase